MGEVADPRAMGLVAGVRWWAGWHPLSTVVAGGGLLGFLMANTLVTWWLRWLGTVAGADDVVGAAVAPIAGFLALGLLVGGGVWLAGAREVNRRFRRGPAAYVDRNRSPVDPAYVLVGADDDRPGAGAEGGESGTAGSAGGRPLLDVPERVAGRGLWLGPDDVAIRSVTVDVVDRRIRVGRDERVVPYDRIAAVEADDESVTLATTDGEAIRLGAERGGDVDSVARELGTRVAG